MAQLTIAPQNIPSGALRHSATRTITATTHDLSIQLTDSNSAWANTHGNIMVWGLQISPDNGTTWNWVVFQPSHADPDSPDDGAVLPFGTKTRGGALPSLGIGSSVLLANVGNLARLAIQVDTTINGLGATITTT